MLGVAFLLETEFGLQLGKKSGHGDRGGVVLEGGKLKCTEHGEGGRESLEDKEYPDCLQSFLVKFGGADFQHELESLAERRDALLHVTVDKGNVVKFLHDVGSIFESERGERRDDGSEDELLLHTRRVDFEDTYVYA